MATEQNPGIHFYSGFREKKHKGGGGAIRNPKKIQVYTFIVATEKNPGIHLGGGCNSKS